MDWPTLGAFAIFVSIMTMTPGPANLTFMAMGVSVGYRHTFPVIMASQIGFMMVSACVAFGLGQLMSDGGPHVTIFKIVCIAYMIYLGYRIIGLNISDSGDVQPPALLEGALIHLLNPKAWAMCTVAYATFFANNGLPAYENAIYMTLIFSIGGIVSHSTWAILGTAILTALGQGKILQSVTFMMAASMVAVTIWSMLVVG